MQNHDYSIHLFMSKLENILIDPIMDYFLGIANKVRTTKSEYGNLKQFQMYLREIKEWGQNGKDEEILQDIMRKKNCDEYFQKLLQGIFQHHIEDILRKKGKDPQQSLRVFQIPKAKNFVHKVYLEFAKNILWSHPQYIFDTTKRIYLREELRKTITNVLQDFIPFMTLLEESSVRVLPPVPDDDSLNDLLASLPPIVVPDGAPIPQKKKKVSSLFESFAANQNDFLGGLGGGSGGDKNDGVII